MTPAEAKQFLKDNDVKFILAQFVDIHGAAKAKAVPTEHLDMVLRMAPASRGLHCGVSEWGRTVPTTWRWVICLHCSSFHGCQGSRA